MEAGARDYAEGLVPRYFGVSFYIVKLLLYNASVNSTCAQPPPGNCGAFARLVSPGGGAFANVVLPGGRAFANPRPIPSF